MIAIKLHAEASSRAHAEHPAGPGAFQHVCALMRGGVPALNLTWLSDMAQPSTPFSLPVLSPLEL